MVYVKGEEMTRYVMQVVLGEWIAPYVDTRAWQMFDLSCKRRDETNDQELKDVIAAGTKVKAIFKEPTITPTAEQKKQMGLKNTLSSPNGKMRAGWNGFAISRDTIHIHGLPLGYRRQVLFDRHAVGGEYGAGFKEVGKGSSKTFYYPAHGGEPVLVDERTLDESHNVVVTYHNPLDNVQELARHFFARCLEAGVMPYVVTKKTVFKWQEPFWQIMKDVFNAEFQAKFVAAEIFEPGEELHHFISDDATMKLIRWTDGGFGMVAHNYDGDMLTDEMSQVHRSPGFITSVLNGHDADGTPIKEFEASHGTISDQDKLRLEGKETSVNPLGLVTALCGAMDHAAFLAGTEKHQEMKRFTSALTEAIHAAFRENRGTRDLSGASGLSTEHFVSHVAKKIPTLLRQGSYTPV